MHGTNGIAPPSKQEALISNPYYYQKIRKEKKESKN
jgi:hypothetical protein